MSRSIPSTFERCYGCLSLRTGVFLNSLCSLSFPYLAKFVAFTYVVPYVVPKRHKQAPLTAPDRYFHVRLPFLNSPVDVFSVIHASTYAIGLAGSYMKSEKLVKYHKYLLYFDVVSTPFIVIERMWRAYSKWAEISAYKGPEVPASFERDTKHKFAMYAWFLWAYYGIFYMKQIYAAYVALRYHKHLLLPKGNSKTG